MSLFMSVVVSKMIIIIIRYFILLMVIMLNLLTIILLYYYYLILKIIEWNKKNFINLLLFKSLNTLIIFNHLFVIQPYFRCIKICPFYLKMNHYTLIIMVNTITVIVFINYQIHHLILHGLNCQIFFKTLPFFQANTRIRLLQMQHDLLAYHLLPKDRLILKGFNYFLN